MKEGSGATLVTLAHLAGQLNADSESKRLAMQTSN